MPRRFGWACDAGKIFLVVVAVHFAAVAVVGHYRHPALDENGVIARNLSTGRGFSMPLLPPADFGVTIRDARETVPGLGEPKPSSNQPPGYPFLLLALWKTLGDGPAAYAVLSLLQALLISTAIWPVAWLTRRWYGETAACWAAWIFGLFPAYLWAATRMHHYPIAAFFHPWVVAGWIYLRARPSVRAAAGVGAITGVGALFQPFLLGIAGLLGLWSLGSALRARSREAVRCSLIAAAVVALVILPWVVRGYRVHHQFVPLKNSFPKEFWIGNNPIATGTDSDQGGNPIFPQLVSGHPELKVFTTEAELLGRMKALALQEIRRDPGGFVARSLRRVLWLWTFVPPRYLPATGLLRQVIAYQVLCWFALAGLALATLRRRSHRPADYVGILMAYLFVYSAVYGASFVSHSRFRGEAEYILIPAAACTLAGLWRSWQPVRRA